MVPKLLQPLVSIPYHPCPNTTPTPFPHSKHHPHLSGTFPHTILPHVKVLSNRPPPPRPQEAGHRRTVLLLPPHPHITPVGYLSPYRSCGLLVPIPLLWATRPHTAAVSYSSPYRSCGLLVPIPLLWATCPHTAPVGYSSPYRSCELLVPIPLLWATQLPMVTPSCRDGRRLLT